MKTLQFKCVLLSDVIINTTAATQGEQTTLDFIPGNNFLGIVARKYKSMTPSQQFEIFHSGNVRFGDAHPAVEGSLLRSLHVPATYFYPKGKNVFTDCYVFQNYSRQEDKKANGKPMQLKQCRKGYYVFNAGKAILVDTKKEFSLKSAYDREQRRALDSQMYGYEAMDKGQSFFFEVEVDNDELVPIVNEALTGIQHIGRSRTAQYGLVEIKNYQFKNVPSTGKPISTINGDRIAVYADSRLIFLNEAGQPTFIPTAENFGLKGEIDWDLSQVRTFQYAPWNAKRQSRDSDRCGIEKGSVFFIDSTDRPDASVYVGNYNNEGFGHIIFNPEFLCSSGDNGRSLYHIQEVQIHDYEQVRKPLKGTPLLNYIAVRQKDYMAEMEIMDAVNDFVYANGKLFRGATFASQWGKIRSIAMTHPTKKGIIDELFDKTEERYHNPSPSDPSEGYRKVNTGYLSHGIAEKKWRRLGRREKLREFINNIENNEYVQKAVVNLASEMSKICTRNEKN